MIVGPVAVLIAMVLVAAAGGTTKGRSLVKDSAGWLAGALSTSLGWLVGLFTGRTTLPSFGGGKGQGGGKGSPSTGGGKTPPKVTPPGKTKGRGEGRGKGKGGDVSPPPKGKTTPGKTPPSMTVTSTTKVTHTRTRIPHQRPDGNQEPRKEPGMSSPADYTPKGKEQGGGTTTSTQTPAGGADTDPRAHTSFGLTLPGAGEEAMNALRAALERVRDYCATVMRHAEGASGFLRGSLMDLHEKASTEAQVISGGGDDLVTQMAQLVESVREASTAEATQMQATYETADASAGFLAPVPTVGQLREG